MTKDAKENRHEWMRRLLDANFSFLTNKYGFEVGTKEVDFWFYELILKNDTTEVILHWEVRDQRFELYLRRLCCEKSSIQPKYGLWDLLSIRAPNYSIWPGTTKDLEIRGMKVKWAPVEDVVPLYAEALDKYASDILRGDFSVFPQLERIVAARREELNKGRSG